MRETGDVISTDEFRALHPYTSFPILLPTGLLDSFGADPVLNGVQPDLTEDQYSVFIGVEEISGIWFTKFEARDMTEEELASRLADRRRSMVVTPLQAKAALLQAGLLDDVEAIISDPSTDRMVVLAWNNALEYRRLSPMITGLTSVLGWSDEQLDGLFNNAANITI
jgi:hypothetical protein